MTYSPDKMLLEMARGKRALPVYGLLEPDLRRLAELALETGGLQIYGELLAKAVIQRDKLRKEGP